MQTGRVVAGVLLLIGALVGLIPVTSGGVNCGSAFVESRDAYVADLGSTLTGGTGTGGVAASCGSLRSLLRIPAIALIAAGAGVGLFALQKRPTPDHPVQRGQEPAEP